MKNNILKNSLKVLTLSTALLLTSCNSGSSLNGAASANTNDFNEGYVQIERLGRPAINEGLVITNDYLNAFNSIAPSQDLMTSITGPVLAEATAVLDVVTGLIMGGPTSAEVAGQFLPDVMRIDTSISIGVDQVGYTGCLSGSGPLLCGGRKIKDDVIDITLSYIAGGAAALGGTLNYTDPQNYQVSDAVAFGTNHTNPSNTFPYLANPK